MTEPLREHEGPVHEVLREMYAALGDTAAFDRHLAPSLTLWEEDRPGALLDREELNALRQGRAEQRKGSGTVKVQMEDVVVDRWPQVAAVARYVLVGRSAGQELRFRCTDVLTHDREGWRIVHRHSSAAPTS